MKVKIDDARCQGHTLCAMIAPKAFELDDIDGHASVASEDIPVDQEEQVREAASSYPERAISIS